MDASKGIFRVGFGTKQSKILRGLLGGFFLNLGLIVVMANLNPYDPVSNVRLTTTEQSVLVYGHGIFGNLIIKRFGSWPEATVYMKKQGLEFPIITYAGLPQADEISVVGQKITWQGTDMPKVLLTPDAVSTMHMAQYLRFVGLNPDLMGFSLRLQNADY